MIPSFYRRAHLVLCTDQSEFSAFRNSGSITTLLVMELNVLLCNHVETPNGLLYLQGGGIDRVSVPLNVPSPWLINIGLGVSMSVAWDETNVEHTLVIGLKDIDGQDILLPTGPDTFGPFKAEMKFNLGRPDVLDSGEPQLLNVGFNIPNLPIIRLDSYVFTCEVDGIELNRVRFKVVAAPINQ